MLRNLLLLAACIFLSGYTRGQIISVNPPLPTVDDTVTITFDATQGSAGLVGVETVYMHTGLITPSSSDGRDWLYVVSDWGIDNHKVKMTNLGNNKHQLRYHIRSFYGVPANETVLQMAFVFRDLTGAKTGKTATEGDIFYEVSEPGIDVEFFAPSQSELLVNGGEQLSILAVVNEPADISLFDNGNLVTQLSQTDSLTYLLTAANSGDHVIEVVATNSNGTARDTFSYAVRESIARAFPPAGTELGATYLNDSTVRLYLYAPQKMSVYVLGSFNNYSFRAAYQMIPTPDNNGYWIDLTLTPGQLYTYQYVVNEEIYVADPFSELILNLNDDQFIPAVTFPNLPPFPAKADGNVSVLQPGKEAYDWQIPNFTPPAKEELVIYELLPRDFVARHDYQTLLDTLDYLENLGVNAIEFMPINEFEGNISWGYNPSFHMALDKYYGRPEDLKLLIDEAHKRGIAIIVDIVLNHVFSQSPLAQLYWDQANFRPTANSPYLNVEAKHNFNVGYDVNHESFATRQWAKRIVTYWLDEYHIDGYRFDLSKGLTQKNTLGNQGAWDAYDASRITILKQIADWCWEANPEAYVILEHFSANQEQQELAEYGMLLWNNQNHEMNEATMGYNSNFEGLSYQQRGWNQPNLVSYMESHDEERLVYKNLNFGNTSGSYSTKDLPTAIERLEPAAVMLFTVPGPKMLWQFNELGYPFPINLCPDGTIDDPCRVDPKPIRWDFFQEGPRRRLYNVFSAMIKLKTTYPVFNTTNYQIDLRNRLKRVRLIGNEMDVLALANFDVVSGNISGQFSHTGWWYEYFSGDSVEVTNVGMQMNLAAGGYRLYTDQRLPRPNLATSLAPSFAPSLPISVHYQAISNEIWLTAQLVGGGPVTVDVLNLNGQRVATLYQGPSQNLDLRWAVPAVLTDGMYVVRLHTGNQAISRRIAIRR